MPLAHFRIDEGPHTMDGLRLIARDGNKQVEAFMSRKVMDGGRIRRASWRTSKSFPRSIQCAWQTEPPSLQRIVRAKYERGAAFNRQHPFVEVLFSDISQSGET